LPARRGGASRWFAAAKGERLYDWPLMSSRSRMAGRGRFWWRRSIEEKPEYPTISATRPPGKGHAGDAGPSGRTTRQIEQCFENCQGRMRNWINTRFATGKVVNDTSRWPCWPMLVLSVLRARGEKNSKNAQVRLSVPELRHLLTALLWRGWHGIEHLLHWSHWPKTSSIPRL